ncbi:MAG: THUMP-like domain-containing protein, partial [Isosphaeraceae bacterium]
PFEVQSIHRLDMKRLKRMVAEQDLGPVEIKMRGLGLTPETLRTQLRVRGSHPATLILAGGVGAARAILAQRPREWPVVSGQ